MSNHRLHALQRQLKIKPTAPAAPEPMAGDLAGMLQAMVDAAVAKHLANAPAKPQQGSRLAALERKLAMVQHDPADAPTRDLRALFDMPEHVPALPVPGVLPAEPITSYPTPAKPGDPFTTGPVDVRIIDRDLNNHIRVALADTPRGQVQIEVLARDPNGHIAQVRLNQHLMNTSIDGLRGTTTFEPVAD